METKHISAHIQHTCKLVPNETLDIVLLFTIHICKLAHLHIHEFPLNLFSVKSQKPSKCKFVDISVYNYMTVLFWVTQPLFS